MVANAQRSVAIMLLGELLVHSATTSKGVSTMPLCAAPDEALCVFAPKCHSIITAIGMHLYELLYPGCWSLVRDDLEAFL